METTVPIAHPSCSEIPPPHEQASVILRATLVMLGRTVKADDLARPPLTHWKAYPPQLHQQAFLGRL